MASVKGRRTSWNSRELRLFVIEKRQEKRSREHRQRERTEQRLDKIYASRRRQALRMILEQSGSEDAFGITWSPDLAWARGTSIWPFARIFDGLVGSEWSVTAVHDIGDSGSPGWLFERVSRAA